MKARITHMKAPWPSGALVGAVVAFVSGEVPVWATGKCVPAGEDEEVEFVIEPAAASVLDGDGTGQALPAIEAINAQVADLQAQVQAQATELEALRFHKAEADAQVADLQAKLAEALAAPKGKAK